MKKKDWTEQILITASYWIITFVHQIDVRCTVNK